MPDRGHGVAFAFPIFSYACPRRSRALATIDRAAFGSAGRYSATVSPLGAARLIATRSRTTVSAITKFWQSPIAQRMFGARVGDSITLPRGGDAEIVAVEYE